MFINDLLKPCPFCGGKGMIFHDQMMDKVTSYVKCTKCDASTKQVVISTEYSSDEKAAKMWNRRTENERDY